MTRKLIMLQGLPGSGKSTWAEDQAQRTGAVVVTKDDIRRDLEAQGWRWSREREADVIFVRDVMIREAFYKGAQTVISADTNFSREHRIKLAELAVQAGAEFEVKKFPTPIHVCIERDASREHSVGISVIEGMVRRYALDKDPNWYGKAIDYRMNYQPQPGLPWAVICDIDGTAAKRLTGPDARSPYDETRVAEDLVNPPVRMVLWAMVRSGVQVVYMSGRHESSRKDTLDWLDSHSFPSGVLYMRHDGDNRKDYIVKGELFDAHVRSEYNIAFALDDRDQVVEYWRSIGLTVFQVAPGHF